MEQQVIDIEDRDGEDNKTVESQPDGASSSQVERIKQASSVLGKKETYSSPTREASEIQETTESQQEESALADIINEEIRERGERRDDDLGYSLNLIERQLEQTSQLVRTERSSSSICIFKLPDSLVGIDNKAGHPEMVSIGPYHHGKAQLLNFEDHKWFFLESVRSRTREQGPDLSIYLQCMMELEEDTRSCYSDDIIMDSHNFTQMMLLDGFFVIELFRHLSGSQEDVQHVLPVSAEENQPNFLSRPWMIPILLRDLLKLENQLPFYVLKSLFYRSKRGASADPNELEILALKVFDLAFPGSLDINSYLDGRQKIYHLLHLVYLSLRPRTFDPPRPRPPRPSPRPPHHTLDPYRSSITLIPSVTQLRLSGIKFKAKAKKLGSTKEGESFLNIDLKNRVLEIPAIIVNDCTSTLFLNCIAWENLMETIRFSYVKDYVLFMNCLVKEPKDVAFLCLDGIIGSFSRDDIYVANLFSGLAKSVAFGTQFSYLSKQVRDLEAFGNSNWATMRRTYFSSPWSVISVSSAALVIALTVIQTVMAVLSYLNGTPFKSELN